LLAVIGRHGALDETGARGTEEFGVRMPLGSARGR